MSFLAASSTLITSMLTSVSVCVFVPLIMTGIVALSRKVANKQSQKFGEGAFNVKYNSLVFGLMIFLVVLLVLASVLFPVLYLCDIPDGPPIEAAIGAGVGFGVCAIISGIFLFAVCRWKICVSEDGIKFIPHFAKYKQYSWQDVTQVKYTYTNGIACYKVFVSGRKKAAFAFSAVMVGGEQLATIFHQKGFC